MIGSYLQQRSIGYRTSAWTFCLVALGTATACGETVSTVASPSGADAAVDGSIPVEASAKDAASDPAVAKDVDVVMPRCEAATYDKSPSGAACDPKRIVRLRGLVGPCYGPALGASCGSLQIAVPVGQEGALPPGFVCGSEELGITTCAWTFVADAGSWYVIDADVLEAACAVTVAFPNEDLVCVNGGS